MSRRGRENRRRTEALRLASSSANGSTTAQPIVGVPIDELGRDLVPTAKPILGAMFTPRIIDRRPQIRAPWTAEKIISALDAAEYGDMGPQADLSEAMQDRDAAYLGFRQTRILAPSKLPWSIEPADDSDLAKEIADFLLAEIKSIPNFPLAHRDLFTAVGPGVAALWIDWQEGGRSHGGKKPKSKYRIDGLHFINPKRYRFHWLEEKFLILPDWGFARAQDLGLLNPGIGPTAFEQIAGAGLGIEPPPWKVIIHRSRSKSGHPARAGIDRVCALPFYLRSNASHDAAVYSEVFGMPFRIAKYPPGMGEPEKQELAIAMERLGTDGAAIIANTVTFDWLESRSRTGGGMPFFEVLKEFERWMQLAWLGQDQTNTHNPTGGRTQVAEGGAPIRQDLVEADCIDAQATYTMQLCRAIVGFSDYGWDAASTLCPKLVIDYAPDADYESMSKVDEILYTKLKLPVTKGMLAKRYKRELPAGVDPEEMIDYTSPAPAFGFGGGADPQPAVPPVSKPPAKKPAANVVPRPRIAAVASTNFAADTAAADDTHSYASTQVNITGAIRAQILELAAGIPDDALADKGREDTPHVTVKYGIDPAVTIDELRPIIGPRAAGSLTFGPTAFFAMPDADVVFVTVDSPDLVGLNRAISDGVDVTDTQANYVPHLTLAHVESGRGHEFAGNGALVGVVYAFTAVYFCDVDGNQTKIQAIRGHVRVTAPKPGSKLAGLAPGTGTWYEAERDWYRNVGRALLAAGPTEEYERQRAQLKVDFAEAQADANFASGQPAIDDMTQRANVRAGALFRSLTAQVREIVLAAPSLEAIPELLRAAFPDLDVTGLQRLTQRTLFVARLQGMADQKRTPPAKPTAE